MNARKVASLGSLILLIAMLVAASGCGGGSGSQPPPPPPPPPPPVSVVISPSNDTLGPTSRRQFAATVTGANPGVSWKVEEGAAGGTVTSNGLYTAPSGTGTFHVTATAVADNTQSATATVSVVPSGFTATGSMESTYSSATLLANGKVLVVGLADGSGVSAELFDPITGTFTPTTSGMVHPRSGPYAVLLGNGKVLAAGGSDANGVAFTDSELFDPATGSFTSTGDMIAPRSGATATLLQNGEGILEGLALDLRARGILDVREAFIDASFAPAKKGVPRLEKQSVEKALKSWPLQTATVCPWRYILKVPLHTKSN